MTALRPEYPPASAQQALAQAIGRLPPPARTKYRRLADAATDAEALVRTALERRRLLEARFGEIGTRARLIDAKYEPDRAETLKQELEQTRGELIELENTLSARNQAKARADQLLAQLRPFLSQEMRGAIRAARVGARPRKNEGLRDAIVRVRQDLGAAQGELAKVRAAPPTKDELERQLRAHVQHLMDQGTPHWTLENGQVQVHWPDTVAFSATGVLSAPAGSTSKLLACLFPDQMFELLCRGLDEFSRDGLSAAERGRRVNQLEQQVRHLEHQEEALVETALAQGLTVDRIWRSGWALLGIEPA